MYILNWNSNEHRLEASFGGYITKGEAEVFNEELRDLLLEVNAQDFNVVLDYATVPRMDDGVKTNLEEARELCFFGGASQVTMVTRDEQEATDWIETRLQDVLEGREQYVAYAAA